MPLIVFYLHGVVGRRNTWLPINRVLFPARVGVQTPEHFSSSRKSYAYPQSAGPFLRARPMWWSIASETGRPEGRPVHKTELAGRDSREFRPSGLERRK